MSLNLNLLFTAPAYHPDPFPSLTVSFSWMYANPNALLVWSMIPAVLVLYSSLAPNVVILLELLEVFLHSLESFPISLSSTFPVEYVLCWMFAYWCPFISSTACANMWASPLPMSLSFSKILLSSEPLPSTP